MTEIASARSAGRAPTAVDAVATHHRDGFRSGVARFNELLAAHLGVPLLGLDELAAAAPDGSAPLVQGRRARRARRPRAPSLARRGGRGRGSLPFTSYGGESLERELVERSGDSSIAGTLEIAAAVRGLARAHGTLWTPGLVVDERRFQPAEISVFSFGMAHKLRPDMFRRLRELLEPSGRSYALYVSAANHETASLRDAAPSSRSCTRSSRASTSSGTSPTSPSITSFSRDLLRRLLPRRRPREQHLRLGGDGARLSRDHEPRRALAAGVRHLDNVIDISQLRRAAGRSAVLRRLGVRAIETARERSWDALVARMRL